MTPSRRSSDGERSSSKVRDVDSDVANGAAYSGPSVVRFSGQDRRLVDAVELEVFKNDIRTTETEYHPNLRSVKAGESRNMVVARYAVFFGILTLLFPAPAVLKYIVLAGIVGVWALLFLMSFTSRRRAREAVRLRPCELAFSPERVLVRIDGEVVRSFEVRDIVRFQLASRSPDACGLSVTHVDGTTSDLPVNAGSYQELLDTERRSNDILEESKMLTGRPFR